jgi:hypothetical protein
MQISAATVKKKTKPTRTAFKRREFAAMSQDKDGKVGKQTKSRQPLQF